MREKKKVDKLHRTASCKCKYLGDLYKIIPTPALVVMILNYCQKVFVVNFCIKFTEKKAANIKLSLYCAHVCTERSCVTRTTNRKTRYMTLLFFKTYYDQFYPVKHISIFIDFNRDDSFFSITSLFKTILFLKLLTE